MAAADDVGLRLNRLDLRPCEHDGGRARCNACSSTPQHSRGLATGRAYSGAHGRCRRRRLRISFARWMAAPASGAFDAYAERAADACSVDAAAFEQADGTAYSGAHGRADDVASLNVRSRPVRKFDAHAERAAAPAPSTPQPRACRRDFRLRASSWPSRRRLRPRSRPAAARVATGKTSPLRPAYIRPRAPVRVWPRP